MFVLFLIWTHKQGNSHTTVEKSVMWNERTGHNPILTSHFPETRDNTNIFWHQRPTFLEPTWQTESKQTNIYLESIRVDALSKCYVTISRHEETGQPSTHLVSKMKGETLETW